jgi:hypothetical protein
MSNNGDGMNIDDGMSPQSLLIPQVILCILLDRYWYHQAQGARLQERRLDFQGFRAVSIQRSATGDAEPSDVKEITYERVEEKGSADSGRAARCTSPLSVSHPAW